MKSLLLVLAVVLVGCGGGMTASEVVEEVIREKLNKPEADLDKVTELHLSRWLELPAEGIKELGLLEDLTKLYLIDSQITAASLKELTQLQ